MVDYQDLIKAEVPVEYGPWVGCGSLVGQISTAFGTWVVAIHLANQSSAQ